MIDYRELRKALRDNLRIEVNEKSKNEMEITVKFNGDTITKANWKK